MNKKQIIELAREAGWEYATGDDGFKPLWRFAELVAQHEREAVMQLFNQPHMEYFGQEIQDAIRARSTT